MTDTQVMAALEVTQADYDRADEHRRQHGLNSINRVHMAETLARHRLASTPIANAEPVAWMYERGNCRRYVTANRQEQWTRTVSTETPLYAAPPPAGDAELRKALRDARDALLAVGNDYPGSSCQQWCTDKAREAWNAIKPWTYCPSTHCERTHECRSINECSAERSTLATPPPPPSVPATAPDQTKGDN